MVLIENGQQVRPEQWHFDPELITNYQDFVNSPFANATVNLGVEDDFSDIGAYTHLIHSVFITIDNFADGRVFSIARQLRQSYGFKHKIVVNGPLIADQYGLAQQCGIDAVLISQEHFERQPIENWQEALQLQPMAKHFAGPITTTALSQSLKTEPLPVEQLNLNYQSHESLELLRDVLSNEHFGRTAVVSSFGAESAVLLHQVSLIAPDTPILFLDTGKHFKETLEYKQLLTEFLGLTGVIDVEPYQIELREIDLNGLLYLTNTTACCQVRKVVPLERALTGFDSWISGRKAYQAQSRTSLPLFEEANSQLKINPLAYWQAEHIEAYMNEHKLPRHPLVEQNYSSIGCEPCTTPVAPGETARAGRWRNEQRSECGIHLVGDKYVASKVVTTTNSLSNTRSDDSCLTNWSF